MKLTAEQRKRLAALLHKEVKDLSDAETKEFNVLKALAEMEGIPLDTIKAEHKEEEGTSEEKLKTLITDAVKAAQTTAGEGKVPTSEEIAKALEGKLRGADEAKVTEIVKGLIPNIDIADLTEKVKAAIAAGQKPLSNEEVQEMIRKGIEDGIKEFRTKSKMEHPEGEETNKNMSDRVKFKINGRERSLSVAHKQLLNVCLKGSSDEALERSGLTRPSGMNDGIPESLLSKAMETGGRRIEKMQDEARLNKAITTGGTNTGAEWIEVDLSNTLRERMYLESEFARRMIAREIDMPTDPYRLPLKTTRASFFKTGETVAGTKSTQGTGDITLDANKLMGISEYSYEADADAIISILPMMLDDLGKGAADSLEGALINGDTTATHMDSDIQLVANHYARLFKGLRYYAKSVGALSVNLTTGGISTSNFGVILKALGRYGVKTTDLLCLAGPKGYNDFRMLTETLTVDKAGGQARIFTGNAPNLLGVDILVSSQVREDLNATGVFDNTTTTQGSFLIVHIPSWILGVRGGFLVETDVDKIAQTRQVIASFRRDFKPMETPSAALPFVAMGRNYTAG